MISSLGLQGTIRTGISFSRLLPSLVPVYEEREAARFGNYNWSQWGVLDNTEKALGIAHYRLYQLIELNKSDAVHKDIKKQERMRKK